MEFGDGLEPAPQIREAFKISRLQCGVTAEAAEGRVNVHRRVPVCAAKCVQRGTIVKMLAFEWAKRGVLVSQALCRVVRVDLAKERLLGTHAVAQQMRQIDKGFAADVGAHSLLVDCRDVE